MFVMLMGAGALLACRPATREFKVQGPEGGISLKVTLPDGFDTTTGQCPMVILMHGIFSSKDYIPMPQLAKGLAKAGIASVRFDFDGHGKSEGRMQDMTIEKELADAQAIWNYVRSLPYVKHRAVGTLAGRCRGFDDRRTAGRGWWCCAGRHGAYCSRSRNQRGLPRWKVL